MNISSIVSVQENIKPVGIVLRKMNMIVVRECEEAMLTIVVRAVILYLIVVITMRGMGKRQMGQLQPYELVMTILIADLIAAPAGDISIPLLHGVMPVAALYVVHALIGLLCMRSDRLRALISGKPSVVISRGVICEEELRRQCLSLSELLEGLRSAGILDPAEVGTAIIEANGAITAFPCAGKRPVNTEEMGKDAGYEGMPVILIMDGRIQRHNLRSAHLEEEWLLNMLTQRRMTPEAVFLMSIDTHGRALIQRRTGRIERFQAMEEKAVSW